MDLSDFINNLNAEDIEKLRETAKSMFGIDSADVLHKKNTPDRPVQLLADPKMIEKIMRLSSLFSENDEKTRFLLALKPLLSEKRQQKADEAIQLQRLLRVFRALQSETAVDPDASH